jgi:hypothetical protein
MFTITNILIAIMAISIIFIFRFSSSISNELLKTHLISLSITLMLVELLICLILTNFNTINVTINNYNSIVNIIIMFFIVINIYIITLAKGIKNEHD